MCCLNFKVSCGSFLAIFTTLACLIRPETSGSKSGQACGQFSLKNITNERQLCEQSRLSSGTLTNPFRFTKSTF